MKAHKGEIFKLRFRLIDKLNPYYMHEKKLLERTFS